MKQQYAIALSSLMSLVFLSACADSPAPSAPDLADPRTASANAAEQAPDFVPGEVIVKFRANATPTGRGNALRNANAAAGEHIVTAEMRRNGDNEGITVVHTSMAVPNAIAALRASPDVEYAEPNYIYQHSATSDDSYYTNGSLWGMYGNLSSPANQYGSQAAEAWAGGHTDCSSVYVGIIDEGYMYNHTDLVGSAATVPGEIAGDGVDNDGNGYIDDTRGWDFANGDNTVFDGRVDDHGTHVAGTIGGNGGNGKGVAGVCWKVNLISAKFLGRNGGTTANAVKAVDYITNLKTKRGLNFVATNNSWGGGGYSQALFDAIARANNADILFIAAAGNSAYNCQNVSCYPAEYANPNVIGVAALTSTGGLASYSNYGSGGIDIGAPGSGIWSTVPASQNGSIVSGYASYSGTSMATPHVTGAAALYAAHHSGWTAASIRSAIESSAIFTSSLNGKVATNGRLNAGGF
jgi:subtilisin family serine protease